MGNGKIRRGLVSPTLKTNYGFEERAKMTKAEEFEKAWRLAYTKKDYSLIKPLLHPQYRMFDHRMGMVMDFETEKSLIETLSPFLTMGPWKILYENDDVYVARLFSKHSDKEPRFLAIMATANLQDGKLIYAEIVREVLDFDPSEESDWNWEDYE